MGMELGKDYQVVTVSFNYKDTPEKAIQKKNTFPEKAQQKRIRITGFTCRGQCQYLSRWSMRSGSGLKNRVMISYILP